MLVYLALLVVSCYAFILWRKEKKLSSENELLKHDLTVIGKDFDRHIIASKTDLKGRITYVNDKFCETSGYAEEELIGKHHNILRHKDMSSDSFRDMWNMLKADRIWSGHVKNLKKDGGYYWVEVAISPIYDELGEKVGYSAVRHDITHSQELKNLNLTLQDKVAKAIEKDKLQNQQLLQQSRLAQMGEMINMIAHQWRQPLNAIALTTNNLSFRCIMDDIDKEFFAKELGLIDNYSQHLSKTIDDFRDFFKDKKVKNKTTMKKLVKETLNIVQVSLETHNIKIITKLACSVDILIYDNEVKQVILNIIKNAEDILLEKEISKATITIETKLDKTSCILIIKDNAGGIPTEIMGNIFDPYFSTKLEKDGTGLGLYMSKTIIEDHCGGTLHVENDKDGAVFTIRLGNSDE